MDSIGFQGCFRRFQEIMGTYLELFVTVFAFLLGFRYMGFIGKLRWGGFNGDSEALRGAQRFQRVSGVFSSV